MMSRALPFGWLCSSYGCSALTGEVFSTSWDGSTNVWSTKTGACVTSCCGHIDCVVSQVFSSDTSLVLTASWGKTAKVWSATTGTCLCTCASHSQWINAAGREDVVLSAVFSSDGAYTAGFRIPMYLQQEFGICSCTRSKQKAES